MTFLSELKAHYPQATLILRPDALKRQEAERLRKAQTVGLYVPILDHGFVELVDGLKELAW